MEFWKSMYTYLFKLKLCFWTVSIEEYIDFINVFFSEFLVNKLSTQGIEI